MRALTDGVAALLLAVAAYGLGQSMSLSEAESVLFAIVAIIASYSVLWVIYRGSDS